MAFVVGCILILGLVVAHLVGWRLARHLDVEPGHAREVMPTLPVAPVSSGNAGQRWNASIRRVEMRLLKKFADGVVGAEATVVAGEINEDEMLVDAAFERLREEIPCRLRITRSGRLLHDFAPDDIASLRRLRARNLPLRASVFLLASLANIGAIWPVLLLLTLALTTLNAVMGTATAAEGEIVGANGLFIIVFVAASAVVLSFVSQFVLTPLIDAPRLTSAPEPEALPERWNESSQSRAWYHFDLPIFFGSSRRSRSSSGGSSGDFDGDGLGQAIIIVILIVIIVACTAALFVWCRGLWRAITQRDDELERVAPGFWVRTAERLDRFERYLPTNDLVGRMARALRRSYAHRRPMDADMGARILALAANRNYRPSSIDIALNEGLDLDEAAEAGARVCSIVGGEIAVSEEGDLVFALPAEVCDEVNAELDDDLWAEYLDFESETPGGDRLERSGIWVGRRQPQDIDGVPVNMVGLTKGHLDAAARLTGGTVLMVASAVVFLEPGGAVESYLYLPMPLRWGFALLVALFAVGTVALTACVRYTADATAVLGVRRDLRRAAFYAVRDAMESGQARVDFDTVAADLETAFERAWVGLDEDTIRNEVEGAMIDLGLTPALDAGGAAIADLGELRRRVEAGRRATVEGVLSGVVLADESADQDAVVFDTQIEHDRITSLA